MSAPWTLARDAGIRLLAKTIEMGSDMDWGPLMKALKEARSEEDYRAALAAPIRRKAQGAYS